MELKQYIAILKKYWLFMAFFALAGAAIAALTAPNLTAGWRLEQTFLLQAPELEQDSQDRYYQQEIARNFTDSAVAILTSPSFSADVNAPGTVSARKIASQVIRITVSFPNQQDTADTLTKTVLALNQKLAGLNKLQLEALGTASGPYFWAVDAKIAAPAGALLGLAMAIFIVALKTYFKL